MFKALASLIFKFGKADQITPNIRLAEGFDRSACGLIAQVISIPGHSRGVIGILSSAGDLFIGDLLENTNQPALNSIMDDRVAVQTSVARLRGLNVKADYPAHSQPFSLHQVKESI